MPDCNHSTASCSCVALQGGGGIRGGFLCPGAAAARGRHVDGGLCYIQTLPPTSVPHTLSTHTHTAAVLCNAGDTGQRIEVVLFCPMCPHPLDPTPLLLSAKPHKDQSPSVI